MLKKMEAFYDSNFMTYDLSFECMMTRERVWNIYFDYKFDLVFLFLAKVKYLHQDDGILRQNYIKTLRKQRRQAFVSSNIKSQSFLSALQIKPQGDGSDTSD